MDHGLKLGFCPTMTSWAMELKSIHDFIDLYPMGSAAQALHYLKAEAIDGIVIGRFAKQSEISASINKRCLQKEGYTLISPHKGFIDQSNLSSLNVVTCLPQEVVRSMLPQVENVSYFDSFNDAVEHLPMADTALIDWHDYRDEYELLIPMEDGEKVKKFRWPVIYYQRSHEGTIKRILEMK